MSDLKVLEMTLCHHCSAIATRFLADKKDFRVLAEGVKLHHQTFEDLEKSALDCCLCEVLVRRLRLLSVAEEWDETSSTYPEIWYAGRLLHNYDSHGRATLVEGDRWKDSKCLQGFDFFCRGTFTPIDLYPDEDTPAEISKDMIGRPIRSADSFDIVRDWIRTCLDRHSGCWSQYVNFTKLTNDEDSLPTRVIDIGKSSASSNPHLEVYSRVLGPYIALSHRWGTSKVVRTTKNTLEEHKKQIPWDKMSKTFQDAIHIARKVDVRYLWIDSLCIIQDDHQDWDRESPKMGYIYMNSILNIAAVSARNDEGGCLTLQSLKREMSMPLGPNSASTNGRICFREPLKHFEVAINAGSLSERAWVQQERLLSRRTLYCAGDQMHWECHESCESEDGTVVMPANRTKTTLGFGDPSSLSLVTHDAKSVYKRWCRVVEHYSSRKMTKATDKLPALSGLASLVANQTGDQYLAGLWRADLVCGLLWHANRSDMPRLIRPSRWRAPSWSWAALDGAATFEIRSTEEIYGQSFIDIVEAVVEVSGENPYGMVSSGYIVIVGRLVQVGYEIRTESMEYWTSIAPSMQDLLYNEGAECGYAFFDEAGTTGELYCLETYASPSPTRAKVDVLLLQAAVEPNVYCRVGIGILASDLFLDISKQKITIV